MAEINTSSWYPLPGGEAISAKLLEREFDFAQHAPDPTGRFNQRLGASWTFGVTADTRNMGSLPAMYQTTQTELLAYAGVRGRDDRIGVSVSVTTPDGDKHTYGTGEKDQDAQTHNIEMIVALLGAVGVDMAEFETRPGRVLAHMRARGVETVMEQDGIARRYDPEQTGKPLAEVTLGKLELAGQGLEYYIRYLRKIELGDTLFSYNQELMLRAGKVQQWQRAHLHADPPAGAEPGDYGFELSNNPQVRDYSRRNYLGGDREISKSEFEAILLASDNILIGPLTASNVVKLLARPLGDQDPLR
jgi:hypothetical protein